VFFLGVLGRAAARDMIPLQTGVKIRLYQRDLDQTNEQQCNEKHEELDSIKTTFNPSTVMESPLRLLPLGFEPRTPRSKDTCYDTCPPKLICNIIIEESQKSSLSPNISRV
jgi:hypothetical protein